MKSIIKNLEKQLEKLRELIQAREDKIDDMSEKWQESEKCEEWEDKTQDIEAQADELDTLIDSLKELN
jgi:hypothetical protein